MSSIVNKKSHYPAPGESSAAILRHDRMSEHRSLPLEELTSSFLAEPVFPKAVEKRIRERKTLLQEVIDGISNPVLILTADFRITAMNLAAARYYGVPDPQSSVGKRCYRTFTGKTQPCEGCGYSPLTLKGQIKSIIRRGIVDPERYEQVRINPLRGNGSEKEVLIHITDITNEKLMERKIAQSQKFSSFGLLVSGIAHELGNLSNCITFNIPILRDYLKRLIPIMDDHARNHDDFEFFSMSYSEFRQDVFRILDNMEHASNRISETGCGFKEFVSMASAEKRTLVDVGSVINKAGTLCRGQMKKTVRHFEMKIAEDLPPIFTDPSALEQVLVNLLINAAQAVDGGDSRVILSARLGNTLHNYLIIEVSDNGCGMDEETKERIFDPFFTTKEDPNGNGLGLFVSKNLIEDLGGKIEGKSRVGAGSNFRITLPI
jgi:signal transduction histidine kinase